MATVKMGKLEEVDIRKLWGHEQYDFSNWLSEKENLELLNETIGLTLSEVEKEVYVGSYRCDLVGKDEVTGERVIIENQLEASNHDHLGKIITYASGLDATVVVWIVKEAREEHRSAIEWLNNNTSTNINFFLIEIHAVQQEVERRDIYCQNYHLSMYAYRADKNPLNGKIVCARCGYTFARKSWANRGIAYWTCKSDHCDGNIKEEVLQKAFITAWNYTAQHRDKFMERWQQMIESGTALEKIRGQQMIELTDEGTINTLVPELMQMVLERIEVHDLEHYTVCFLDGTKKEILI